MSALDLCCGTVLAAVALLVGSCKLPGGDSTSKDDASTTPPSGVAANTATPAVGAAPVASVRVADAAPPPVAHSKQAAPVCGANETLVEVDDTGARTCATLCANPDACTCVRATKVMPTGKLSTAPGDDMMYCPRSASAPKKPSSAQLDFMPKPKSGNCPAGYVGFDDQCRFICKVGGLCPSGQKCADFGGATGMCAP